MALDIQLKFAGNADGVQTMRRDCRYQKSNNHAHLVKIGILGDKFMNEIQTVPGAMASIVPTTGDNFELSASNPTEMVQCHETAIEWCKRKIELVKNETKELFDAFTHAEQRKWKSSVLKKHWELAQKRVDFYEKMKAAFDAGYYIVPNFPATVFAIRTDKDSPSPALKIGYNYEPKMTKESAVLPIGEGEYQNPEPVVRFDKREVNDGTGNKKTVKDYWCDRWQDLEFPANMAKLHIMAAATRAMALKVFDEVCMLPSDRKRHADPMLIGTIILKTKSPYSSDWKKCSFMIGWHIDTKTL